MPTTQVYHGLVRAVVRVTSLSARPRSERALLRRIDLLGPAAPLVEEAGGGAEAGGEAGGEAAAAAEEEVAPPPIVVEASAEGFAPVRVSIPVSTDAAASGVMAVAEAAAGQPVDFFGGP